MKENPDKPLVSVIVLNYNGKGFLKDCFDSLHAASYPNQELIMMDNDSSDGSIAYVNEHYPSVKTHNTGGNIGYSGAYNRSFEIAKGKYFVLLNNDTRVEQDWLEPLVEEAEKNERIGALQPKIVSMIDKGYFEYAGASGGHMDQYGFPFLRGRIFFTIEKDEGQYDDIQPVFWTSGAALFIRSSALKDTGGLDEDFVHHMEEIDLCWRLHLHGYELKVVPQGKVHHHAGATIKPDSYQKIYWNHRNSLFMLRKNLGKKNLGRVMRWRWFLDMAALFKGLVEGQPKRAKAIINAYGWMRKHRQLVHEKRQQVQRDRKVDDERIFKKFYPRIIAWDYFVLRKKTFRELDFSLSDVGSPDTQAEGSHG